MRCDVIAKGIIDAAAQLEMKIPIVVRLQGKQLRIFTSYDSITIETVFFNTVCMELNCESGNGHILFFNMCFSP